MAAAATAAAAAAAAAASLISSRPPPARLLKPSSLPRKARLPSAAAAVARDKSAPPLSAVPNNPFDDSEVEPRGVMDFIERSKDLVRRPDGGPPRWFSPVECGAPAVDSPPLFFFLPGIDGVGLGLIRHHQRLGKIFDVWCLHIPVMDRTPFEGLVEYVETTIKLETSCAPNRPIYLVGESLGACIALAIAARNPNTDFVLILGNPATSFYKSQLQSLSMFVGVVPEPLHATIPHFLSFITGNPGSADAYVENELSFQQAASVLPERLVHMVPWLTFLFDVLPKDSLLWKLEMLKSGSLFVNSRLHAVKAQLLVLASGRDQLLPSREEAERLCSILSNCRIRHFKDSGHTIFLDGGIDLVTIIKGTGFYRRSRQINYVSDYLLPTRHEFEQTSEQYRWLDVAASPVMLSTLENGKIARGLEGIPLEGPAVLVGYHMLLGWELGPLVLKFLTERSIHLRGIAHPFMFDRDCEMALPDYSWFDGARLMGAVPVSATNFYNLLSRNSFVLLYPGGAREALHRKGEQYKLFWPEQPEFIRMASRFGATIIPFGVVGEDDFLEIVLDYDDLVRFPFYSAIFKRINRNAVKLRVDSTEEVGKQDLHLPGFLPKNPGRFYFLFGRPIETRGRREELKDRERAQHLYLHVQSEVENCINYLKGKREKDPYRYIWERLPYLATQGFSAEIPTFEL